MSEGIYESVMGSGGQTAAPGLEATTDVTPTVDLTSTDHDQLGLIPQMSEQDWNSLYTAQPTGKAQAYDREQSTFDQPTNPRMADRGTSEVAGVAGKIVRLAQSFVGTPYVWGGTTPDGFDCSGFVQYVYRKVGINLPRVSYQQANSGKRISMKSLQAGDLVAWDNSTRNNGADHIAIYLGSGLIAEAPRPGVPLRIRRVSNNEGAFGVRIL